MMRWEKVVLEVVMGAMVLLSLQQLLSVIDGGINVDKSHWIRFFVATVKAIIIWPTNVLCRTIVSTVTDYDYFWALITIVHRKMGNKWSYCCRRTHHYRDRRCNNRGW
uniref:Uncharacterized protein n=1 Tax=Anopheles darlingi TaxID=43151 RepID=A0A2M4D2R3_ANODA